MNNKITLVSILLICISLLAADAQADTTAITDSFLQNDLETINAPTTAPIIEEKSLGAKIWGEPMPSSLHLGMVTTHFNPSSNTNDNWNNELAGIGYDGYFAATFINSFEVRAYAVGIERNWILEQITPNLNYSVGYRLGLVTGYTKRFMQIAAYTPVLPFPQVAYDLTYYHAGLELSWCIVTVSAGLFYRF